MKKKTEHTRPQCYSALHGSMPAGDLLHQQPANDPAQLGAAVAMLTGLMLLVVWPFVAPTLYRWTREPPPPVRRIRMR